MNCSDKYFKVSLKAAEVILEGGRGNMDRWLALIKFMEQ